MKQSMSNKSYVLKIYNSLDVCFKYCLQTKAVRVNSMFNITSACGIRKNCCLKNRTNQSFYFIFFHIGFTFCKENTAICRNMASLGHNKDITSDDQ